MQILTLPLVCVLSLVFQVGQKLVDSVQITVTEFTSIEMLHSRGLNCKM